MCIIKIKKLTHAQLVPPYLSIAKSIPFWSLLLLHYGNVWGVYFILTGAPKFMNEVTYGVVRCACNLSSFIKLQFAGTRL